MPDRKLPPEAIIALLGAGLARLEVATEHVPTERLHARPASDDWSANEVLAHLRSCADVWGGCIATILDEEAPTIRAVNPTTWIERTNYLDLDFHDSFRAFAAQRLALLGLLGSLEEQAWERTATVTGAGRALVRSVHGYAKWLATHERSHVRSVERMVAAIRSGR